MSWRAYHRLQGLIFVGWGLLILYFIVSGKILFYINRRFVFLILLTGVVFIGLAAVVLTALKKEKQPDGGANAHPHEEVETHSENRPPAWSLLILVLPLILGTIIPPRPLGSSVLANRGVNATAPLGKLQNSSTTAIGLSSSEKSVLDWVADFNSGADPTPYVGQQASVTGFVYHDPRMSKDQFLVGRFVVTCCVADALALGMVVDWPGADKLVDNTWVQVKGAVDIASLGGERLPGIGASEVKPINTPDQPYLFP